MKLKSAEYIGILNRKPGNPRNSEGSFLQLEDGRIAFAYSRYCGTSDNDHADCNICVVYSRDGGMSFDTEHYETLVEAAEYGEKNVMSVTLRRMNNGDIGLFYLLKHPKVSSDYMLRRYRGDFSHCLGEVKCFPHGYESYFVVNNDRVLHRADGTWIIPAAYHHSSINKPEEYCDGRGIVYFFSSGDDGQIWTQNWETLRMPDNASHTGLQEPGLVELPNGALYAYARTDRMYQYEAVSVDGGEHWFGPQASQFTSPASPMLIKRNPHSGKYYAIWNPTPKSLTHPQYPDSWGRTPLVMAESEDGTHFSQPVFLETDPTKGYCYPAMEFLDEKTVLVSYCSGGAPEGMCLNRTVIRRLEME